MQAAESDRVIVTRPHSDAQLPAVLADIVCLLGGISPARTLGRG